MCACWSVLDAEGHYSQQREASPVCYVFGVTVRMLANELS